MKTSIIFMSALLCFSFAHAQNGNSKPVSILYVIKSGINIVKTNHLFIDSKEIAHMDLPPKAEASKSLGAISEDVIIYITLKKGVKLLTLSKLLANNNLGVEYENIPVYIDGEAIANPCDILSTETGIKNISKTSERIDINTRSGPKIKNMDVKTVH